MFLYDYLDPVLRTRKLCLHLHFSNEYSLFTNDVHSLLLPSPIFIKLSWCLNYESRIYESVYTHFNKIKPLGFLLQRISLSGIKEKISCFHCIIVSIYYHNKCVSCSHTFSWLFFLFCCIIYHYSGKTSLKCWFP